MSLRAASLGIDAAGRDDTRYTNSFHVSGRAGHEEIGSIVSMDTGTYLTNGFQGPGTFIPPERVDSPVDEDLSS